MLLEALVLLTSTRSGREIMRQRKVYPVIRNLHLSETSEDVHEIAERVVQMLMRDESLMRDKAANENEESEIVEL
jgi:hypothetical protein